MIIARIFIENMRILTEAIEVADLGEKALSPKNV